MGIFATSFPAGVHLSDIDDGWCIVSATNSEEVSVTDNMMSADDTDEDEDCEPKEDDQVKPFSQPEPTNTENESPRPVDDDSKEAAKKNKAKKGKKKGKTEVDAVKEEEGSNVFVVYVSDLVRSKR
eukprot:CAMPEP_0203744562 /NCGR_PEP_ID=MMETSP0098-20131031/589_1 /ASSEMBLY_ACC=CAM_ASM_000208 /TAXON_ID=96639 /ORGANISM=" , Strain NY0313808BC1" /LENGTH=125 /DNA_ID=CAMNT_0050632113 /DNA_START=387 /DNA_END=765 /DNA_ORIENTATION=+